MSQQRKSASARERDLRLAMVRIELGRSHTKAAKISIASVAREAGVSPALIYNHYERYACSNDGPQLCRRWNDLCASRAGGVCVQGAMTVVGTSLEHR